MYLRIKKSYYPGQWVGHWSSKQLYGFLYLPGYCITLNLKRGTMKKPPPPKPPPPRRVRNVPPPPIDDYTPENVSGVEFSGGTIALILAIIALLIIALFFRKEQKKDDHIVIDKETHSIVERPPGKGRISLHSFPPGTILTGNERGDLIEWDSTQNPEDWIVGRVTESGKIEYYPFIINPEP